MSSGKTGRMAAEYLLNDLQIALANHREGHIPYGNVRAEREKVIAAIMDGIPSPPSEDLPGMFEEYEKAALTGFCANPSFADTSEDKIAGYAEAQASAQMMRFEARKAREVKHD